MVCTVRLLLEDTAICTPRQRTHKERGTQSDTRIDAAGTTAGEETPAPDWSGSTEEDSSGVANPHRRPHPTLVNGGACFSRKGEMMVVARLRVREERPESIRGERPIAQDQKGTNRVCEIRVRRPSQLIP